jgi:hypothetical protein
MTMKTRETAASIIVKLAAIFTMSFLTSAAVILVAAFTWLAYQPDKPAPKRVLEQPPVSESVPEPPAPQIEEPREQRHIRQW